MELRKQCLLKIIVAYSVFLLQAPTLLLRAVKLRIMQENTLAPHWMHIKYQNSIEILVALDDIAILRLSTDVASNIGVDRFRINNLQLYKYQWPDGDISWRIEMREYYESRPVSFIDRIFATHIHSPRIWILNG